jgi:hypothetical protein
VLPTGRLYDGSQKRLVTLERIGKMLRYFRRRHDAGRQSRAEGLISIPDLPIAETPNEVAAVQRERPCTVKNEPTDWIGILTKSDVNGHLLS